MSQRRRPGTSFLYKFITARYKFIFSRLSPNQKTGIRQVERLACTRTALRGYLALLVASVSQEKHAIVCKSSRPAREGCASRLEVAGKRAGGRSVLSGLAPGEEVRGNEKQRERHRKKRRRGSSYFLEEVREEMMRRGPVYTCPSEMRIYHREETDHEHCSS